MQKFSLKKRKVIYLIFNVLKSQVETKNWHLNSEIKLLLSTLRNKIAGYQFKLAYKYGPGK